ncbi:YceD family protein [Brevibacterium album]|uniref:YceD family protein n=1 Tax=Brevibacterium album TaxID=417948 RepID=UPI00041295F7|nr:YceD family protein [Brevibacterium album]
MRRSSEFILDTRKLGLSAAPGKWEDVSLEVRAPEDLRIEVIGVPEGSPMRLDLRLESVVEGIYVSGTVHATAKGEDARTLEDVEIPVEVSIEELFAYQADPQDEETYVMEDDMLDLEPAVRDAVVMSLPFRPLKDDDEGEFSYTLGEDITEDEPEEDPRWAALKSVLNQEKES